MFSQKTPLWCHVLVVTIFVLGLSMVSSAVTEGATCYEDGGHGRYTSYAACRRRGGYPPVSSLALPLVIGETHSSQLICCKSSENTNGARHTHAHQSYPVKRESTSDKFETINDLREALQEPDSGRRKHSIASTDYTNQLYQQNNPPNTLVDDGKAGKRPQSSKNDYDYPEVLSPYTSTSRPRYPTANQKPIHYYEEYSSTRTTPRTLPTSYHRPDVVNRPTTSSSWGVIESSTQPPYKRPYPYEQVDKLTSTRSTPRSTRRPSTTRSYGWDDGPAPLVEDEDGYPIFTVTTTTRKPHLHKHKHKPRISEIKCKEYSQIVRDTVSGITLTVNAQPVHINIEKCNYNAQQLIVGGQNATLGEFPHMAAIGFTNERGKILWNCGGSLISEHFVLTAAHCTTSAQFGPPKVVRLGEHNLVRDDEGAHPVQYAIKEIIKHPEYRSNARYHDIALLRLSRHVTLTPHIRPACLYRKPTFTTGKTIATGWGRIAYAEQQSDVLLKVVLSIINNDICNKKYQAEITTDSLSRGIINEQMCAGELRGGKDTCQGDSGGPIEVTSIDNQCIHHIIGVTSFGKRCGLPNAPGVYTRVSAYLTWIEGVVWPEFVTDTSQVH